MSLEAHDHDVESQRFLGREQRCSRGYGSKRRIPRSSPNPRFETSSLKPTESPPSPKDGQLHSQIMSDYFRNQTPCSNVSDRDKRPALFCGNSPRGFVYPKRGNSKKTGPAMDLSRVHRTPHHTTLFMRNSCVYAQLPPIVTKTRSKSMSYRASDLSFFASLGSHR